MGKLTAESYLSSIKYATPNQLLDNLTVDLRSKLTAILGDIYLLRKSIQVGENLNDIEEHLRRLEMSTLDISTIMEAVAQYRTLNNS